MGPNIDTETPKEKNPQRKLKLFQSEVEEKVINIIQQINAHSLHERVEVIKTFTG